MSQNIFITESRIDPTADGVLDDMTVAVKDNISTAGIPTTCGSAMLADYVPPFDATVIELIRDAGGTIVGKTNMDEFGMGTTTETSAFGPTTNPAAPGYVPGGSSGGSAAAVAAGNADVALGSDTGGSIRCPAAFCGVVGLKPTYGLVSRYGLVAYANSLEQIGPLGTNVADVARLLDVIAGEDTRDATTVDIGNRQSYETSLERPVDGLRVGIPDELVTGVDEAVEDAFEEAIAALEAKGIETESVSLPELKPAVQAYYVIAMSEASSNLARFDGVRYGHADANEGNWNQVFANRRAAGFGEEVKRRILLGTFALSAGYQDRYYRQAQAARRWLENGFDEIFDAVDLIASPTMPVEPFELGTMIDDPLTLYRADRNTVPINLANIPAISVPVDTPNGLPIGLQLSGPAFSEALLLQVAATLG